MVVPIPIPIGAKRVAAVRGAVWKFVACGKCHEDYAYLLELEAVGEDHDLLFLDGKASAQRAQAMAQANLVQQSRNVVLPVPCPHCGHYQDDMAQQLKDEASINVQQIVGVVIVLLALVPLALDVPHIWVLTVVLALVGLALVIQGCRLASRFDPNAGDPEPRKEIGRRHAVWGEQLAELRPAQQPADM